MRNFFICLTLLGIISCGNTTQNDSSKKVANQTNKSSLTTDSSSWQDNFLKLSAAISNGDRQAVKSFIDFPIKNKGNEIWFLGDSRLVMEISRKEIKPFTESDYDKYFSSIFAIDLRKTLEKLNVQEFFQTNKSTSPEIVVVEDSKSKLEATYDVTLHQITLVLVTTLTSLENSKFTIYYYFEVLKDQQIKFRQVHVE